MERDLETEVKKSDIGVKVHIGAGIAKGALMVGSSMGLFMGLDITKELGIPIASYIATMTGLLVYSATASADIELAIKKRNNYLAGKNQFRDRSEDPSKISSASLQTWKMLGAVEEAYFS